MCASRLLLFCVGMGDIILPDDVDESGDSCLELPMDVHDESDGGSMHDMLLPEDVDSEDDVSDGDDIIMEGGQPLAMGGCSSQIRKFPHYLGPKREELPQMCPLLEMELQDPCLWPMQESSSRTWCHDDVAEVYSPRRVLAHTGALSLAGDLSVDLLTGWDLNTESDRRRLASNLAQRQPRVLITSPPCTMFCSLMASNWFRMLRHVREARWAVAIAHLQFTVFLCSWQHACKRGFVFEHPARALSWGNLMVQDILKQPGVFICEFDMCAFHLVAQDDPTKFHRKPTRLLTNIPSVHRRFHGKKCPGNHEHIAIQGSARVPGGVKRSYWAQHYPEQFCEALAGAVQEHCCMMGGV